MKMPMPIRLVLCWFAILIFATVGALGYCSWKMLGDEKGLGVMLSYGLHAVTCLALPVGFFYDIIRRKRELVEVPYLLIGIITAIVLFGEKLLGYSVIVFLATVIPVSLMNFPISLKWFNEEKDRRLSVGCGFLILLATLGIFSSSVLMSLCDGERKMRVAYLSACAMQGRNLQRWIREGNPDWEIVFDKNEWNVLDAGEDMVADFFPVMITANFDIKGIPQSWDGVKDQDKLLKIRGFSQEAHKDGARSAIDKRAIIVIRKGGTAQRIKAKYLTLKTLMCGMPYKLSKPLRVMSKDELKRIVETSSLYQE